MDMSATIVADRTEPVLLAIRLLLLEARCVLLRDPAAAERCIEGAVGLLPDAGGDTRPSDVTTMLVKGGLAPWQVLRVRKLVEAHLGERLTGTELAAATRLSP